MRGRASGGLSQLRRLARRALEVPSVSDFDIGQALPLQLVLALLVSAASSCSARGHAPPGFQGIVEYDDRVVAFEVEGRVASVPARRGDAVKVGDVLATVDDTLDRLARDTSADEARAAEADLALTLAGSRREDVASLAAELRAAQASEDLELKSLERAKSLLDSQAISQADYDRAVASRDRAKNERASVEQRLSALRQGSRPEEIARARARAAAAKASLALAEERLARHSLRAGISGEVLDVHVEPGELATTGEPASTIADTTHPYVDVFVPQGDLAGIHVGTQGHVKVDAEPAALPGTVEHVYARAEFTPKFVFSDRERPNIVIRVRVRIDDPARLLHAGVPAFVQLDRP